MQVVVIPKEWVYGRMLDWSAALANLTSLSIVTQQPVHCSRRLGPPSSEHQIEEWVGWLKAILQHIVSRLPTSCIVEVDDYDESEMSDLMKECLPSGYQKVQTLAGDILFE